MPEDAVGTSLPTVTALNLKREEDFSKRMTGSHHIIGMG